MSRDEALPFRPSPRLTLGVEIELQLLDAAGHLAPVAPQLFERLGGEQERIKAELFQSMIEINTGICTTVTEARRDLDAALVTLAPVCAAMGVRLAGGGSHPFARYRDRIPYPADRFRYLIDRNRWIAQRLIIFGMHVHVGARDGDHAMALMNALLPHSPLFLALSASSPFWDGVDTGLASSRVTVFEAMPTAGLPTCFETWRQFERFHASLVASGSIGSLKDLWWDVRPSPHYGTVELRICDGLPTLAETIGLVALIHGTCAWLDERIRAGERIPPPEAWILRENKWRASRWGLASDLVVDASGRTRPMREAVDELVAHATPYLRQQGCAEVLDALGPARAGRAGHERQRVAFARRQSLVDVAELLAEEFRTDTPQIGPG
jgi:carboxylate-amine ligase